MCKARLSAAHTSSVNIQRCDNHTDDIDDKLVERSSFVGLPARMIKK